MPFSAGTTVRFLNKAEVDAKLLAMAPRILAANRATVDVVLDMVIAEINTTPGYRTSLKKEVSSSGVKTTGKLLVAMRGYWREFGTHAGYRGRKSPLRAYTAALERASGGGGEKAGLYATSALHKIFRMIAFYYGKTWSKL